MTLGILNRGSQPRLTAPKGPFVFNQDSPQAQGLVFWAPAYTPGKLLDLTRRNQPTVTLGAAGEWNIHPVLGRYVLDLTGADNHFTCPTNGFRSDQGTIMAWWEIATTANHRWMYSEQGTANNNNEVELLYNTTTDQIEFFAWDGTANRTASTDAGVVETGKMIHWAGSWNSISIRLFKDGVFKDSGIGSTPNVMATTAFWGTRASLDFRADMKFGDCRMYDWKIPNSLVAEIADPLKRDDLVYELGRTLYFFAIPPPPSGGASLLLTEQSLRRGFRI